MACWKMVGFEVTPSTPSSNIRCRFPFWMSSRESESTQTLCPISCSFFSRSFTATTSSSLAPLGIPDERRRLLRHGLRGEAEPLLQVLQRRRRPEGSHADGLSVQPDVLPPAKRGSLLHGYACGEVGRDDALTVVLTLLLEEFPRRHAHHAGFDPLAL